jgi:hypothetical protein
MSVQSSGLRLLRFGESHAFRSLRYVAGQKFLNSDESNDSLFQITDLPSGRASVCIGMHPRVHPITCTGDSRGNAAKR